MAVEVGHSAPEFSLYDTDRKKRALSDFRGKNVVLGTGMTLAIEPMLNAGTHRVTRLKDGWTVVTEDRKLSVHFEHTIAVADEGARVLTAPSGQSRMLLKSPAGGDAAEGP